MRASSKPTAAWWIALSILVWAGATQAQDDPFGGGDDELSGGDEEAPPEEEAPAEEEAPPEEEAPAEDEAPAEPAAEAEAGVEGEAGGSFEAGVDIAAPEVAAEGAPVKNEEEIIVTGSRVKRTSYSQPSSVQVVGRQEIQQSGATNMADVVKYLSINSGSEFNTDLNNPGGTAQFNLRGLGLNTTLVLLNGRRMVPAATAATDGSNFVDINAIPMHLIERIEILKGGASAIYGSDAVAGVVNMITRKDLDGFEAQVGGQTTDDFDQHEWDVALTGGAQGERTRVVGTLSYFRRSPLMATDRDFTKGSNVSNIGQPSAYVVLNDVFMVTGVYQDPACPQVGAPDPRFPYSLGSTHYGMGTDMTDSLPFCTFNYNPYFMLTIDEQRANTYLTVEHDVSNHTQVFAEAGYARSRAFRTQSPSFPVLQTILVPPNHAYNNTGSYLRWYGRAEGYAGGPSKVTFDSDTFHTVAGIGGDFGGVAPNSLVEDWGWEIAGSWSTNDRSTWLTDALTKPLQDAINSCTPEDDPADCYNPFGSGAPNSEAVLDKITGELSVDVVSELTTVGADLNGDLVELPGGDLGFAIGAQARREMARSNADHDANQENYVFLIGGPDFQAERDILAAYGELIMPFMEGFELQAAARLEDYDDVGSSVDPKFGISWTPAESFSGGQQVSRAAKIRFHGTYATSFRAPSLLQTGGSTTTLEETFDAFPDMADADMDGDTTDLAHAANPTFRAVRTQGNPTLDPETSNAITAGIEWGPVEGLNIEGDYWRYDYQDIVVKQSHQQLIDADYSLRNNPAIVRGPDGTVQRVNTQFVNAPSLVTHGIDFGIHYGNRMGDSGTLSLGAQGTYVLSYEMEVPITDSQTGQPTTVTLEAAGNRNFANPARSIPQLRMNFPLAYSISGHTIAFIPRFISGYDNDDETSDQQAIDAWFTLDFQYSLTLDLDDNLVTTLKVGMQNAFDSDPPTLDANLGYDVYTHDPRGRLLYARLIQEF